MINLKEALGRLEAAGSEQTRKTYARHGVTRPMYGVSFAALEKLRKEIKIHQHLAEALWDTGNHDARVLATMIADPAQASPEKLAGWMRELDHHLLAWGVARLASKSPRARDCFEQWSESKDEEIGTTAWTLLAELAQGSGELKDAFFEQQLKRIERDIHQEKNRTRYGMNGALIAIGIRNPSLEKLALAAAGRIGHVEVDHGDTACKTPDAAAYIKKAVARKKSRKTPAK